MSKDDELTNEPLTGELESFESRLADVPIPHGQVDRDHVMYRAGWEAALSQTRDHTYNSSVSPRLGGHYWTKGFGSLSAVLAILLMLQWQSADVVPTAERITAVSEKSDTSPPDPINSIGDKAEAPTDKLAFDANQQFVLASRSRWQTQPPRWNPNKPAFVIRQKLGTVDWFQPVREKASGTIQETRNCRSMLNEYLDDSDVSLNLGAKKRYLNNNLGEEL